MTAARRVSITIEQGVTDELAVSAVLTVIEQGRISDNGKQYCYVATFDRGTVCAYRSRTGNDCFHVYEGKL